MADIAASAARLKEICDGWNEGGEVKFQEIVYGALSFIPDCRKKLAREFGCGRTTVDRWANGGGAPATTALRRIVVNAIGRLAAEAAAKA